MKILRAMSMRRGRKRTVKARRLSRTSGNIHHTDDAPTVKTLLDAETNWPENVLKKLYAFLGDRERRDEIAQFMGVMFREGKSNEYYPMYRNYVTAVVQRSSLADSERTLALVLNDGSPMTHSYFAELGNRTRAMVLEVVFAAIIELHYSNFLRKNQSTRTDNHYGIEVTSGVDFSNVNIELKAIGGLTGNTFSANYSLGQKIFGMGCNLLFIRHTLGVWKKKKDDEGDEFKNSNQYNSTLRVEDDQHTYFYSPKQTACSKMQKRIRGIYFAGYVKIERLDEFGYLLVFFDKASSRSDEHGDIIKQYDTTVNSYIEHKEKCLKNCQECDNHSSHLNQSIQNILKHVNARNSNNILTSRFVRHSDSFYRQAIISISDLVKTEQFLGLISSSNKGECTLNLGTKLVTKPSRAEINSPFVDFEEEE
jgi:hypothetical protein